MLPGSLVLITPDFYPSKIMPERSAINLLIEVIALPSIEDSPFPLKGSGGNKIHHGDLPRTSQLSLQGEHFTVDVASASAVMLRKEAMRVMVLGDSNLELRHPPHPDYGHSYGGYPMHVPPYTMVTRLMQRRGYA